MTKAHKYCALRISFGCSMALAWIWSTQSDLLFLLSWAAFLWALYPFHNIINEREKKTKEERIAGMLILIAVVALAFSLFKINEIEEISLSSAFSLSLLMIGLSLARWASLRKIPDDELSEDLKTLLLYQKNNCEPVDSGNG